MMADSEFRGMSPELAEQIAMISAEYEMEFSDPKIQLWLDGLNRFNIHVIRKAVAGYIKSPQGRFKPHLADIITNCEALCGEAGWLGADEAWAKVPKNEFDSAMMTDESVEAFSSAKDHLAAGDRIAARRAFIETYERLAAKAKLEERPPRFFLSAGADRVGRENALAEGVRRGQISLNAAVALLPDSAERIIRQAGVTSHPLLEPPTKEGKEQLRKLMLTLNIKKINTDT